ncbi:MAG: threonyl-tRNA synthetase [Francisellaceae bacterium]|jgi:threonyl-tRNA synthetase
MPEITLPDGSKRVFDQSVSVMDIATDIGPGLAKATLAGVVNGHLLDATVLIEQDSEVKIITSKNEEGLEILRHSCAHILAQAVKRLFPKVQVTIGPVIEDGFYYDFASKNIITIDDLSKIESEMSKIIKENHVVSRKEISRNDAVLYFEGLGELYKAEIIKDIPEDEILTLYTQGEFTDLCRGPHIPSTGAIKAFKLMKLTGAYWRADSNNEMLQRIYGTCWSDKKALKDYLFRLEESEKRDHRKLGKELDLYHFQEESPGMAYWHPNGTKIWRVVEDYMRDSNSRYGCTEIRTPLVADISLWEKSGHKDKFADNMFMTSSEHRDYVIRPMNCPTCIQVYNHSLHSYRDLPVRMAEFGIVHRNESSGSLHGLMRVRSFTQDDGHVFCTQSQIAQEVGSMVEQCYETYKDFGFNDIQVKLALRPDNRIGNDDVWDETEKTLGDVLTSKKIHFDYLPGEGAFYGPKIEFHLKDAIGRSWQCGTIQLDFSMPNRLGATYVDENSQKIAPVMLHRAIVGSLERFIGMLIEHFAGKLPVWLAPVQVVIIGITNKQDAYIQKIRQNLTKLGFRVKLDLRNEKIGFKIREHTLGRIPYLIVVGDKEQESNKISIRRLDGKDCGILSLEEFGDLLNVEISKKARVVPNEG